MSSLAVPVVSQRPRRPKDPARAQRRIRSPSPHLLLVANGNASGLDRRPELVADSVRMLRSAGARVESVVTSSLDELELALASAERRVVLLGGDGSLHAAANAPGPKPELALHPGRQRKQRRAQHRRAARARRCRTARRRRPRRPDRCDRGPRRRPPLPRGRGRQRRRPRPRALGVPRERTRPMSQPRSARALGALARFRPMTMAIGLDGSCELDAPRHSSSSSTCRSLARGSASHPPRILLTGC